MNGKELDQKIRSAVGETVDLAKPKPEPLPRYRIRWSIQGTTYVEAKDYEDAEHQADELDAEHLIVDLISIDIYDIGKWPPEWPKGSGK